jgi:glycosyltransferase involved in cell wall biosynthesis
MNILFLDQYSDLGGAQRCLIDLLPAVRERGWQAHVAAPGNGELCDRAEEVGAAFHPIHCGPYQSDGKSTEDLFHFARELPLLAREIAELAGKFHAGIVYVNGPRLLPAACLALRNSLPLIFHCHSFLRQHYAASLAGLSLAGSSATMIASCSFVVEPLRLYAGRFHVVYNGVASGSELPTRALSAVRRIGVLGRIGPEKGQLEFVQAARLLGGNHQFVVCGAPLFSYPAAIGYYERVRECASGLPVEFLGWREDVAAVLAGLDLLVVPSAAGEATTRVILEAYAAGVPVVASSSGGIPEIVSDGETGYLVPPGDPARLAARIRDILTDPAALLRVAENGHRAWRERFTLERYQSRILSILATVGSNARA